MKTMTICTLTVVALILGSSVMATESARSNKKIDWYGTLESGLAEAERTNKPILLLSAAPQCLGVPGIW